MASSLLLTICIYMAFLPGYEFGLNFMDGEFMAAFLPYLLDDNGEVKRYITLKWDGTTNTDLQNYFTSNDYRGCELSDEIYLKFIRTEASPPDYYLKGDTRMQFKKLKCPNGEYYVRKHPTQNKVFLLHNNDPAWLPSSVAVKCIISL